LIRPVGLTLSSSSFFTLRPPPTSPLFPYTTLFRSPPPAPFSWWASVRSSARSLSRKAAERQRSRSGRASANRSSSSRYSGSAARSEEHTSELQSLTNLVCRLLLEKKNNESEQIPTS